MNRYALLAASAVVAVAATTPAAAITFTGTTAGGPTYNRTLAGDPPTGLSAVGTAVNYGVVAFNVAASTSYTLTLDTAFDSFLSLYTSFDAATPLANILEANDDGAELSGSVGDAAFSRTLAAGNYFAVVTSFANGVSGDYALTIDGRGAIGPIVSGAVPEPASWAMMIIGFGVVGAGLRRRQRVTTTVRFA